MWIARRLNRRKPSAAAAVPPALQRTSSMAGNILVIKLPEGDRAYWLQRKMCDTSRGSIRVAFLLEKRIPNDKGSMEWTVQPSNGPYPFEMMAIKIQDKRAVESAQSGRDATVEFAALQAIAALNESSHAVGTRQVCTDADKVYIIMPYHGEGSLFQYVVECGRLSEGVARHFFRQIISVRIRGRGHSVYRLMNQTHFWVPSLHTGIEFYPRCGPLPSRLVAGERAVERHGLLYCGPGLVSSRARLARHPQARSAGAANFLRQQSTLSSSRDCPECAL